MLERSPSTSKSTTADRQFGHRHARFSLEKHGDVRGFEGFLNHGPCSRLVRCAVDRKRLRPESRYAGTAGGQRIRQATHAIVPLRRAVLMTACTAEDAPSRWQATIRMVEQACFQFGGRGLRPVVRWGSQPATSTATFRASMLSKTATSASCNAMVAAMIASTACCSFGRRAEVSRSWVGFPVLVFRGQFFFFCSRNWRSLSRPPTSLHLGLIFRHGVSPLSNPAIFLPPQTRDAGSLRPVRFQRS